MSAVMPTSPTSGALVIVLGSVPSMAATMCLVTAFLDPLTATSPTSGPLGRMCHASANSSIGTRVPGRTASQFTTAFHPAVDPVTTPL